jgi:nucleosome assembly protein 1-like 1
MGRKQAEPKKAAAKPEPEPKQEVKEVKEEEKEEDPPIVKELKVLDDKYLEIEREYEKEVEELKKKFLDRKKPLFEERQKVLVGDAAGDKGTPKLEKFWTTALKNHPGFEDTLQEWDEDVMTYLRNVAWEPSGDNGHCLKLTFTFTENPYFEPLELVKEYHCVESSPYTQEIDVKKVVCTEIQWKPGKDVTVEKVQKKVKGGGAKKAKQKGKETIEPRNSIFRSFFRSVDSDEPFPDDLKMMILEGMGGMDEMDDEDDEEMIGMFLENDYECATALRDSIIPYAVRWYTGEAAPEDDSDDDEDSEEEDDSEDEDDEDDEEDSPAPKKGKAKADKKKAAPTGEAKEECKQQ